MNKHKITIVASSAAFVVALGASGVAYSSYHQSQTNQQNSQVAAANNKAKAAQAQFVTEKAELDKVYAACIAEAKLNKVANPGKTCAD